MIKFKDNIKNIIIVILLVLFAGSSIIIYKLTHEKEVNELMEITGTVIVTDSEYVIIESDNEDYVVSNIKGTYNVGDEVKFSYLSNDLSEDNALKRIKINDEEIIKVNFNEDSTSNTENNTTPNNDKQNTNKVTKEEVNTNSSNKETHENKIETNNKNNNDTSNSKNNTSNITNSNNIVSNNTSSNEENSNADIQVLSYFNDLKSDMDAGSIKDSFKNGFITVVDFLFYNGTIKGYTFSELSNSAKLKVLSLALYFDNKIEKYFPGYKESISGTTSKIYTNVKEKVVSAYLNLTTSICAKDEELCTSAKAGFIDLKTNFNLTWSLIKDIAGDGITNLKTWYEVWSGK